MSNFCILFFVIKIVLFDKINSFSKNNSNNLQINANNILSNNTNVKRNLQNDDDNYEPISIYFDTYYLTEYSLDIDSLVEEKNRILESLNKVKNTLEKLIKVPKGTEKVNPGNYKVEIESFFKNEYGKEKNIFKDDPGLNSNLVIFVDYFDTRGTDFYSKYNCTEYLKIIKKASDLRPTIGYIMINPQLIPNSIDNLYKQELYNYILLHQTTHILGFTRNVIENKLGIGKKTINRNPKKSYEKQIISSTKLMDFAEKYFNCPKSYIKGIELEELKEYSKCDEYIHWDARIS
jgi:hypothetical protein